VSRPRLIALLLVLVTLAVYLPVTHHEFVSYDDNDYITDNLVVQDGLTLAGVKWAFSGAHAANWHPVTWLSHMMDCELFQLNAGAHHLVNVLFHATNAGLLFFLLWRLTEKMWPAAFVAALFAWHPLHVESVAWAAERKDVLSTFFALLTLLSYMKFVRGHRGRDYWLALFFFALGLMAKPMLVTLPFVLLLLDFWPLQRLPATGSGWQVWREKTPFLLLSAISCVITLQVQHPAMSTLETVSLGFRLENSAVAAAGYLQKLFWPDRLAIFYPFVKISPATLWLALATLLIITSVAWWLRHSNRCWLFGWLWFLGTLVPVIGLVQVGTAIMADRYTYIPSIGIFIAIAFGLPALAGKLTWLMRVFAGGAVVWLLGLLVLTEHQLRFWQNTETLFHHALAVTQNNATIHSNLGWFYEQQGRAAEALAEYREAARIDPQQYQLHFSMGTVLEKTGQPAEALVEYRYCLAKKPNNPALHNAIGGALTAQGKWDEALKEFAEAERLDAHYAMPHIETAKVYFAQGRDDQATNELWVAVQTEPFDFHILADVARHLAANTRAEARDGQSALILALKANELTRGLRPEVLDSLGMAFAETGDFTNAIAAQQNALDLAEMEKSVDIGSLRQRLELYQNHQPWRESFGLTNALGQK